MSQFVIESNCAEAETAQCASCSHESRSQGQPNSGHSENFPKIVVPLKSPGPLSAGLFFPRRFYPKTADFKHPVLASFSYGGYASTDSVVRCPNHVRFRQKKPSAKSSSEWPPVSDVGWTATENHIFLFSVVAAQLWTVGAASSVVASTCSLLRN